MFSNFVFLENLWSIPAPCKSIFNTCPHVNLQYLPQVNLQYMSPSQSWRRKTKNKPQCGSRERVKPRDWAPITYVYIYAFQGDYKDWRGRLEGRFRMLGRIQDVVGGGWERICWIFDLEYQDQLWHPWHVNTTGHIMLQIKQCPASEVLVQESRCLS